MTAREFLSQIRDVEKRLSALRTARDRSYYSAVRQTPTMDKVVVDGGDIDSRKAEDYAVASIQIEEAIEELEIAKAEVLHVIRLVRDNILATLLIEYYVNCRTWEETASKIHYSTYDTSHRKHFEALDEIQKILDAK